MRQNIRDNKQSPKMVNFRASKIEVRGLGPSTLLHPHLSSCFLLWENKSTTK